VLLPLPRRSCGNLLPCRQIEGPGACWVTREQPRFLRAQRRGAHHRQFAVAKDELHCASREVADTGRLTALPQLGEMLLEIAQMPIDPQRAPRSAVRERVEMLVAREGPRLVMEALHQPVEELAHANRLAPVSPGASGYRGDFRARGLDYAHRNRSSRGGLTGRGEMV